MNDETLVVLLTSPRSVPLYWVDWGRHGIVCHLFTPDDAALRQRVVDVLVARQSVPCLLRHPLKQCWYDCDVYVADIKVGGTQAVAIGNVVQTCEITLVSTGPITALAIPLARLQHHRPPRCAAGTPRRKKPALVAADGKE